jgi:hypothetical protein
MSSNEQAAALIDDETQALLSAIGNHEAKSLVTAVINSQPDLGFSVRQLEREMITRQGENPAWYINSGTLADYCTESLLPLGAVAREEEAYGSRMRRVYSASDFGIERGLPLAGAVIEWSLSYPKHSVQKLLGITAVAGESTRAPITSFLIMQELLTNPRDGEISSASISRSIGQYKNLRIAEDHLRRLEGEKLVELRTVVQDYNPIYKINRDEVKNTILTNDASIAVRDAWLASPKNEMTLNELLEVVAVRYPDLSPDRVRRLMTYVVPKQRLPFLEVTERNGAPINQSDVKLTASGRELMGAFVEAVDGSAKDEEGNYRKLALDVVSDASRFKSIMDKAKTSSNSASTALSRQVVLDEVKSAGEITVTQLREVLAAKGLKVGDATVRRILTAMSEQNQIQTELVPLSNSLKRKAVHYRVAE